jgi:hypothetical protein
LHPPKEELTLTPELVQFHFINFISDLDLPKIGSRLGNAGSNIAARMAMNTSNSIKPTASEVSCALRGLKCRTHFHFPAGHSVFLVLGR